MERNKYIYFNIESGVFVFTNEKKTSKKYIFLPSDEMYKVGKRSLSSIKNYIIKNSLTNSFFYSSLDETRNIEIPPENEIKSIYKKPNGIWINYGTSWLDVALKVTHPSKKNLFSYVYKIDLFNTIKIITDKDDLFAFIKKYRKKPDELRIYDIIDWERVKQEFDGLIIVPHLGIKLWRDNYETFHITGQDSAQDFFNDIIGPKWKNNLLLLSEWYRSWECAGGIIWNTDAIANLTLIKKTNYKKYLT